MLPSAGLVNCEQVRFGRVNRRRARQALRPVVRPFSLPDPALSATARLHQPSSLNSPRRGFYQDASGSRFWAVRLPGRGSGWLTPLKPTHPFVTMKKVLWRQPRHCRPPLREPASTLNCGSGRGSQARAADRRLDFGSEEAGTVRRRKEGSGNRERHRRFDQVG
jgi:hypothetical protein